MFTHSFFSAKAHVAALLLLTLLISSAAHASRIEGQILDDSGQPLAGGNVLLEGTRFGGATDLNGRFVILGVPAGEYRLQASLMGYKTTNLELVLGEEPRTDLTLTLLVDPIALEELIFKAQRETAIISVDEPVRTEVIGQARLMENSDDGGLLSALSKQTGLNTRPCALCGSAGIGMQGLDPSYTEVTVDGLPLMSGLGALYGFDGLSVSDLDRVEMVKGSGSNGGGASAMAGSVNLVTSSTANQQKLHLNLTGGSTTHHTFATSINAPLFGASTGRISLNYGAEPRLLDLNNDGVTDAPQYRRGSGSFSLGTPVAGVGKFRAGGRYFAERRFAGVTNWTEADRGSASIYGREIYTTRAEATTAFDHPVGYRDEFKVTAGMVRHNQDSWYGVTEYDAEQLLVVSRAAFDRNWSTLHQSEAAVEYRYDQYQDNLQLGSETDRLYRVPGLHLRHTWTPGLFWLVQGSLLSERYEEEGFVFTPRASLRYQPSFDWTFILAGGTGFRPVTIFSLDKAVHAGFDNVHVPEDLKPERNYGGSFTANHRIPGIDRNQSIDFTAFYTRFRNKVELSYGSHQDGTTMYTNADDAYTRGVEVRYDLSFSNGWSWALSGTVSDVRYRDDAGWHLAQMQNRFTVNSTVMKSWHEPGIVAEVTGHLFGPQALPEGRSRSDSPTYLLLDLGLSKQWGAITLAGTVKNALDYVQPDNPLVIDPLSGDQQFDSAMIYGPLLGRVFLVSLSTTLGG